MKPHPTLTIAVCAFTSSFLGCYQVMNLSGGRPGLTALTSCAIAFSQLHVYALAPKVTTFRGKAAYTIAGLLGAQLALFLN